MKLRSLSLQLFRQHIASEVDFADGLTGIIGTNGSGKTTIVEAIGFAIYGSKALRGKVEDVRTRSTLTNKSAQRSSKRDQELKVVLHLEHEGVVFRIERTLSEAVLYVGGESKPVAVGTRDVTARISTIVGMSYDEFTSTYCTEQKGLEFLSGKKGATEREKFIVRMMGYDRLEEMQDFLRSDRKDRRAILTGYEASLGSREEIEKRIFDEQAELDQIRIKHDEAARVLASSEQSFGVLRERMIRLEDARRRFLKERENTQAAQVRLEERRKRHRVLTETAGLARADVDKARMVLQRDHIEAIASEALSPEGIKKALDTTREAQRLAHEGLRELELTWRDSISRISMEQEVILTQIDQQNKKAKKLNALSGEGAGSGECPTCGQPLGGSFQQVKAHYAEELERLTERRKALDNARDQAAQAPLEVTKKRAEASRLDEEVKKLEVIVENQNKIELLEQKAASIAQELTSVEGEIKLAEESARLAAEALTALHFSEEEYAKEKGAHDASQRLLEVSRLQRVRLEGEVNTKEALIQRSRAELLKFDERQLEVDRLRREVRTFDECDRILTDFRKFVNAAIRPRLAELASEYLADLTDGRYTAVELEEDFTPTVVEDGEPKRVISGGEEDILNLCMRISLSHMLAERAGQHFSLLMLDEVFGSLDEGRRSNVLSLLEKLRKRFEQIIIITHLDDIKDGVQHLIQVDYDEGSGTATMSAREETYAVQEVAYNF